MAFTDLHMQTAAEAAVLETNFALAPVSEFAHYYSELDGNIGDAVKIPDFTGTAEAGEFDEDSNNYQSGDNTVDGLIVNLDKHLIAQLSFTDRDYTETAVNFFVDGGKSIGKKIAKAVNGYVFGMINATNVTQKEEVGQLTKNAAATLFKVAADYDLDVADTVLVLDPLKYSQLLASLDSNVYGGPEAIRKGMVPGLFGFKSVICSNKLPEGTVGALVENGAIGITARYLPPSIEGAYPISYKAVDENGVPMGFRFSTNLASGRNYLACDALVGAKVLLAKKIVRLEEASTDDGDGD